MKNSLVFLFILFEFVNAFSQNPVVFMEEKRRPEIFWSQG